MQQPASRFRAALLGLILPAITLAAALSSHSAIAQAQTQPPVTNTAARPAQLAFDTPQAAADALVAAVRQAEPGPLIAVLGPGARRVIHSGDTEADEQNRARFLAAHAQGARLEAADARTMILLLGDAE